MKVLENLENTLIVIGTSFGITQIESVLGIIILSFQVMLIFLKYTPKAITKMKVIIQKLKKQDFNIESELEEMKKDVEDVIDDLKGIKDEY